MDGDDLIYRRDRDRGPASCPHVRDGRDVKAPQFFLRFGCLDKTDRCPYYECRPAPLPDQVTDGKQCRWGIADHDHGSGKLVFQREDPGTAPGDLPGYGEICPM